MVESDEGGCMKVVQVGGVFLLASGLADRKSTRLNSSHGYISYAVFCLKKKNKPRRWRRRASSRSPCGATSRRSTAALLHGHALTAWRSLRAGWSVHVGAAAL